MLEEKRNSTVLRQFWFVDVENTLPAIMVERVLCIYWDYSSISIFSSDLSSTVKWSSPDDDSLKPALYQGLIEGLYCVNSFGSIQTNWKVILYLSPQKYQFS